MLFIGNFTPPGDKSVSHRLILLSILAKGEMIVSGLSDCADVNSSLEIFQRLGGKLSNLNEGLLIEGLNKAIDPKKHYELDCGNSGTTMRLACGLLASIEGNYILDGDSQLKKRPMERVAEPLRQMGAIIECTSGRPPLKICGSQLTGANITMKETSAQVKSSIILAALSANSPSTVIENIPTRDHTEKMVSYFNGHLTTDGAKINIQPSQLLLPEKFLTPADPSSAAFLLTAAAITPGSDVTAENILLSENRIGFLKVLDRMGATVELTLKGDRPESYGDARVKYNGSLQAVEVEAEEIPSMIDEIPILSLAAMSATGETIFRNVAELKIKETDRLAAIKNQLGALGANVHIDNYDLHITGPQQIVVPDSLDSGHDHRLAMTLALASKIAQKECPIIGLESIKISYPNFLQDLNTLCKK